MGRSYGVLLYEVASLGEKPFSRLENLAAARHVLNGHRLERPQRCPDVLCVGIEAG